MDKESKRLYNKPGGTLKESAKQYHTQKESMSVYQEVGFRVAFDNIRRIAARSTYYHSLQRSRQYSIILTFLDYKRHPIFSKRARSLSLHRNKLDNSIKGLTKLSVFSEISRIENT